MFNLKAMKKINGFRTKGKHFGLFYLDDREFETEGKPLEELN